ncbi:MAG TPA: cytidylate kinase family protein [Aestuariivirgaceae bacterium]|nr:cytidylate kinase family protein [Aestuariivirgaceae bacterium]
MTIIAMTREMGTRGKDVASQVAVKIGLELVHYELIETHSDQPAAHGQSEVRRFLEAGPGSDDKSAANPGNNHLTPDELFRRVTRGNVIIRGWGVTRLLHPIPHVLCVRICAPMALRVTEMMRRLNVTEGVARRRIKRSDALHTRAFMRFFESSWRDAENYDLVLNTEHLSIETCVQILIDATTSPEFEETEETRQTLRDRLLAEVITTRLRRPGALARRSRDVYADVSDGIVRLYGAVGDSATSAEVEKLVRSVDGVEQVQNEIVRLPRYNEY